MGICQRPQSREQSLNENPDSRRGLAFLPSLVHIPDASKWLSVEGTGGSEPQGTEVTPLCSIRAAFLVSGLSVGGAPGPQFQDLNNHSQSPLAEGGSRKEVGRRLQGPPPGPGGEERRGLKVQGC